MSKKATIIAVVNQKGGTGKTTTTENLGVGLALEGKKVLLVDTDPQASLTVSLGNPCPDELSPTLSDLMGKIMVESPIAPGEGILHHPEGVDLVPSNIELSGMEVALVNAMSRETILRQYLDTVKQNYDYILLDCMPSLGMVDMLVNYSEEFDDILPTLLARSFQKNAEMVCEYRVLSSAGEGIDYQGTVLLNSRAVRLLSYVEDTSGNEKVRTIQSKELWLTEDMTFYVVSCMSTITMDKEEAICLNEHRSVVTTVECEDDIFFDMGSLICELDDICLFELLADADATIYEL